MKRLLLFVCFIPFLAGAQDISLQELVNQRKYKEVLTMAETLSAADSTYANLNAIGQAYEGLLRYPKAYQHYSLCLQMDSTNTDMLNTVARMAVNMGRAKDAERLFSRVLEGDSANFYANYQLARLYYQLGEYEKAIVKYEFLIENDVTNSVLLRNLGDCYMQMELLQPAEACYHLAFQHNPENASLASTLINTMLRVGGDWIKYALTVCDTALYYNPKNRQLERNKAMTLYMNKRYADADSLYSVLLAEGDSSYLTLKYTGVSRYYAGLFMKAIEPLEKAYAVDTTQVDVCLLLGSSFGKTYDRKLGHTYLDKAAKNMEPLPIYTRQLLKFRAETFRKDGKIIESDRLYYKAWQEEPENLDLLGYISNNYFMPHIDNYTEENGRQRAIFIRYLYVRESLKEGKQEDKFYYRHRYFFQTLYNDMFFRSVDEEPMLAPDGKKSMLKRTDLRLLINELPEIPERTQQDMDTNHKKNLEIQKEMERRQKEKEEQLKQQQQAETK